MNNARLLVLIILLAAASAMSQVVTLPRDVEHNGVLLDATRPISFYRSGKLEKGTLKIDHSRDGRVFEIGTAIVFFEDGSISSGTLKLPAEVDELPLAKGPVSFHSNGRLRTGRIRAGSRIANLAFDLDTDIGLNSYGVVTVVNVNLNPKYRMLGVSLRNETVLVFDDRQRKYSIFQGTMAENQLIARLVTERDTFGMPTKAIPVIAPPNSTLQAYTIHPTYALGQQNSDRWSIPGTFQLNGHNFGNSAALYVRDMRLIGIQIFQDLTIGGIPFKAMDVVMFSDIGTILPRGTVVGLMNPSQDPK